MNQEQLCRFSEPENPKMCGPFSFGEYSFATNGHILVRVPRLADVPEWEALNEKAAVLFDALDYTALNTALVEIPIFPQPEPQPCPACSGSGKVSTCPECDGEGEVGFSNDFNNYECECLTCDGFGKVSGHDSTCFDCNGTGKARVIEKISVGNTYFSSHYLTMLKELPGMKIAPTEPEKGNYFKWDEGDGLLMPMRA